MDSRLTKIVCTLGPACDTPEQLEALVENGMSVARINLSHGSREKQKETIAKLKKLNENRAIPVGILLDTRGAEIRTGDVQTPIIIAKGETVTFSPPNTVSQLEGKVIAVNYDGFANDVRETKRILVDNGELSFDIVSVNDNGTVTACAKQDGTVGTRRHVNLPGADIDLPSITEQDWDDIAFAAEEGVDFIALSFIRNADELKEARSFLNKKKSTLRIITKVETAQAVENIAEIIRASDGIMVARGDLGAEVPFERLPVIQDEIVVRCADAAKPVIVATHMLESMKEHPIPTRAEMMDVAHAASTGADATMLSGETATGKHPPVAVDAMHRLLFATEQHSARFTMHRDVRLQDGEYEARAQAAVSLAESTDSVAILVFTRTGQTAHQVSKFRPRVPIVACTNDKAVQGAMTLNYGTFPLYIEFSDPETTIKRGMEELQKHGFAGKGDRIILVTDIPKHLADWSIQQRIL